MCANKYETHILLLNKIHQKILFLGEKKLSYETFPFLSFCLGLLRYFFIEKAINHGQLFNPRNP